MPDASAPPDRSARLPATLLASRLQPTKRVGRSARSRVPVSEVIFATMVQAFDLAVLGLTGAFAYYLHLFGHGEEAARYFLVGAVGSLLAYQMLQSRPIYSFRAVQQVLLQIRTIFAVWTTVVAAIVTIAFFFRVDDDFSRGWILIWYGSALTLLTGSRLVIGPMVGAWVRSGRLAQRIVLLGADRLGQRFVERLMTHEGAGVEIVGIFDDRKSRLPSHVCGLPILGRVDDLIEFVKTEPVDTVVIALPLMAEQRVMEFIRRLRQAPLDVRVLTDFAGFNFLNRPVSYVCGVPVINVVDKPIKDWRAVAKALEDRIVASLALLILAPLLLFVAALVRIDSPGPALYRQRRRGFNNNDFECFKFRTMYQARVAPGAEHLTKRNDPRITRIGKFLRKSSIDELPQLLNVLFGDMSIVGPRPHPNFARAADKLYDEAVADYAARHRVKPGITGWAQVNGWRGPTETIEQIQMRVEHDLHYIDHWSVALDLWIMFLTVFKGFVGKNAY